MAARDNGKGRARRPPLVDLKEFAFQTGYSLRQAQKLAYQRRIKVVKMGRKVLVPQAYIDQLIEENTIEPRGNWKL